MRVVTAGLAAAHKGAEAAPAAAADMREFFRKFLRSAGDMGVDIKRLKK
jgi:hypothetical protein